MSNSSSSILSANQSAVAQFWLEGVLTPVVSLAGVIGRLTRRLLTSPATCSGNTVCILVLTIKRKDLGLKPCFIDLLTLLVRLSFFVVLTDSF